MKKIIAMILCLTMFMSVFICVPVSADSDLEIDPNPFGDEEYRSWYRKLNLFHGILIEYYYYNFDGYFQLDCCDELYDLYDTKYKEIFGAHGVGPSNNSLENIKECYNATVDLLKPENFYVSLYGVTYIYALIKDETNENGFYDEQLWERVENLKKEFDNCNSSRCSYDLFDELVEVVDTIGNYIPTYGDVNADGFVTMKDVIKLQRSIAGLDSLNLAQKSVAAPVFTATNPFMQDTFIMSVNMHSVIEIQKYIAGISGALTNRSALLHKRVLRYVSLRDDFRDIGYFE